MNKISTWLTYALRRQTWDSIDLLEPFAQREQMLVQSIATITLLALMTA
jgi:hypothetical protein